MRKYTQRVSLKNFLKLFKCLASSGMHMVYRWLDLLLKALYQERKRRNEKNSLKACIGTLSYGHSHLIYRHLVCGFFVKIVIIMSISTNIHRTYVCDPLDLYISLVNNSLEKRIPYWSTLINYPYQHID